MAIIENDDGKDTLTGTAQSDEFVAQPLNELHRFFQLGRNDNDKILAGAGSDLIIVSLGSDYYDGGDGYDRLDLRQVIKANIVAEKVWKTDENKYKDSDLKIVSSIVDLKTGTYETTWKSERGPAAEISFEGKLKSIESIVATDGDDILRGSDTKSYTEEFWADAGNDLIDGRGGYDYLEYGVINGVLNKSGIVVNYAKNSLSDGAGGTDKFSNIEEIGGGIGADVFNGDSRDQIMWGKGQGNDKFFGGGGYDTVYLNTNLASAVQAGVSVDLDLGRGSNADGHTFTFKDIDVVGATRFKDTIKGSNKAETFKSYAGEDVLMGNGGNDKLDGGADKDTLTGGIGKDTFVVSSIGVDTITDFKFGTDRIEYNPPASARINLGAFKFATFGSDLRLDLGNKPAVTLKGGVKGFGAFVDDVMVVTTKLGIAQKDGGLFKGIGLALGNIGNDIIEGTGGKHGLSGEGGNDTVVGSSENELLLGGTGNDKLDGGSGNDRIFGNSGNDTIKGGSGDDLIVGGAGGDQMTGGNGKDIFRLSKNNATGDEKSDLVIDIQVGDKIDLSKFKLPKDVNLDKWRFSKDPGAGDVTLVFFQGTSGTTRKDADWAFKSVSGDVDLRDEKNYIFKGGFGEILGSKTQPSLLGTAASDVMLSLGGKLTVMSGGGGNDWMEGSGNGDTMLGAAGNDTLNGLAGKDTLTGGVGDDVLIGGNNNDVLLGGDGDDFMQGGTGADTFTGGDGKDRFYFGVDDFGGGTDVITDFNLAEDRLIFDFRGAKNRLTYSIDGTTAVVTIDGNSAEPVLKFEFKGGLQDLLDGL